MEHIVVADTNLFFECKRLEDLPWAELGLDPVVVALTKPVLAEIDKHKKGGGRTRKRALDVSRRVRAMLGGSGEEVIRDAGPLVVLRLWSTVRPDPDHELALDYNQNDDRIVGIVSAITKDRAFASVRFLTDDSVAASTAQSLGLPFMLIPEPWKRPTEETAEAKQIRDLRRDLAAYRAQEPCIALRNTGDARTRGVRRVPAALGGRDVDSLIETLRAQHPMQGTFDVPETETRADGTTISYEAPDPEAVTKYKTETYPNWVTTCRSVLERLHDDRIEKQPLLKLRVGLANKGTRPASRMRVSFEALGDIRLRRALDDSARVDGAVAAPALPRPLPRLPLPPDAPQVRRIAKRPALAPAKLDLARLGVPAAGLRIGNPASAGTAFDSLAGMRFLLAEVERATALADAMRIPESVAGILLYAQDQERLTRSLAEGLPDLGLVRPDRHIDVAAMQPFVPRKHDPEVFYYDDWPPDVPVRRGALTCDLFRHRGGEEFFAFEVLFPQEGDVNGAVLCTVHAENLTEPVELRIPVGRTIEQYELMEAAEAMVANCR